MTIFKNSNERKRNEKDNCDGKKMTLKKRHIKVKLKTNKGLQEGIFIFYFFNLLLASPITETKNTKCLIRQECHNRGKQLICNNRQTNKQTRIKQ